MAIKFDDKYSMLGKRYLIKNVAHAVGISESAISAYFNNRKISTSGGITLQQIVEVCKTKRRGDINWDDVHEIEDLLRKYFGMTVVRENEDK